MYKNNPNILESIFSRSLKNPTSLQITSLFHTSETFPDLISAFLKEEPILGQNLEELSLFLTKPQETHPLKPEKVIQWIKSLLDKVFELDPLYFKLFYMKLLGITIMLKIVLNIKELEVILAFYYKVLKSQKFKELKAEISDTLYIILQIFHINLQKHGVLLNNFYNSELLLTKCLLNLRYYNELSQEYSPIILRTFAIIFEEICKDLIKESNKETFAKNKEIFLKILKKTTHIFDFLLFSSLENKDIIKEQIQAYESLFNGVIYFILFDNYDNVDKKFKGFMNYKTISEILIKRDEKEEEFITIQLLKKELLMGSKNEKNSVNNTEDMTFISTLEGLFKVIFKDFYLIL